MSDHVPVSYDIDEVLDRLPAYCEAAVSLRDTLLANLVMAGEIPSPTFREERRIRFLTDRFNECGLSNCSTDESGNGFGLLPGTRGKRTILMTAHADTSFDESVDHTITLLPDKAVGPGISDDSLGIAALATMPNLMEKAGVVLRSNLLLMGATRSLGRGNMTGLRFFLDHSKIHLSAGLCVEGVQLGRLSHESLGMMRCEIQVNVPELYDWTRFGAMSAITTLNEVINHVNGIRLPRAPRTSIMLGRISGGSTSVAVATTASLRLEIRSEADELVEDIGSQLKDIVDEVATRSGATVDLDIIARRNPGGIGYSHPLTRAGKAVLERLDVQPRLGPSISELSAFIYRKIPALTVGLTRGSKFNELDESIEIAPIFTGMAQLLALIEIIDRGTPDAD